MRAVWATSRFVTASPTTVKGIFIPEKLAWFLVALPHFPPQENQDLLLCAAW